MVEERRRNDLSPSARERTRGKQEREGGGIKDKNNTTGTRNKEQRESRKTTGGSEKGEES